MKIRFEKTIYYEVDTDSEIIIKIIRDHSEKAKSDFVNGDLDYPEFDLNKNTTNENLKRLWIFLNANLHNAKTSTGDYIKNIVLND